MSDAKKIEELFAKHRSSSVGVIRAFVYLISCRSETQTYVKIGHSKDPRKCLLAFKKMCPLGATYELLGIFGCIQPVFLKHELHLLLKHYRKWGEWFVLPEALVGDMSTSMIHYYTEPAQAPDVRFVAPDISDWSPPQGTGTYWIRCQGELIALGDHIRGSHWRAPGLGDNGKHHWYQLSSGPIVFCDNVWYGESENSDEDENDENDENDDDDNDVPADEICDAVEIDPPGKEKYQPQRFLVVCGDTLCTVAERDTRDRAALASYKSVMQEHLKLLASVCRWPVEMCHSSVISFRKTMTQRHLTPAARRKRLLCPQCGAFCPDYSRLLYCKDCPQNTEFLARALQLAGVPDPNNCVGAELDMQLFEQNAAQILQLCKQSARANGR